MKPVRNACKSAKPFCQGRCGRLIPDAHGAQSACDDGAVVAIDGKTARRTHDRRKGLKALHTLSAYATTARLTLAQLSVPEKTNEITAIPDLLDHLAETNQLLLAGQSRGGFLAMHYACLKPGEVMGVVNFSGGWYPYGPVTTPYYANAGRGAADKVPQFWLYADNDRLYDEALIREYYQAFTGRRPRAL